ncbi:MAG: hypothetical protein M3220_13110, partial [Chloroflexota bacterium]|nr:hypothetical protein [Chloroflexota bacterium]
MDYSSVEEYHVRLEKDGALLGGRMWLREEQEWEVEAVAGSERLAATVEADVDMRPHSLFQRVVEKLGEHDTRIWCCGTCAHFRCGPT